MLLPRIFQPTAIPNFCSGRNCARFGWAFTLTKFARTYSSKFKLDREKLMKKFWGDNFFSPTEKKFVTEANGPEGELPRCFVQFIMKPIVVLTDWLLLPESNSRNASSLGSESGRRAVVTRLGTKPPNARRRSTKYWNSTESSGGR